MSMSFSYFKLKKTAGFTLVEMVVVLAIFMIMTMVVLANLPDFRSKCPYQVGRRQ